MRLDQTIVPWTTLWLFYFEEWLASDDWKGGGMHPRDDDDESMTAEKPHDTELTEDEQQRFRILSLDGGGIRGVFPAALLARLEEHLEHPIGRYFDLIAGTSTGGIIAIGLGLGLSAQATSSSYT